MILKGRQYRANESLTETHESNGRKWQTFTTVKIDNTEKIGKLANSQRKQRGKAALDRQEAHTLNAVQLSMMPIDVNRLTRGERKAYNAARRAGNVSEFKKRYFAGLSIFIKY